jgi:hypothetical protein
MRPSFSAFTEELLLIKSAEEAKDPNRFAPYKQALKHMLAYGLGYGAGDAAGILIADRITPQRIASLPPEVRSHLPSLLGVLGGIGTTLATVAMEKHLHEKKKEKDSEPSR